MKAIEKFLPHPRHTEVHRIFVNASPIEAWQAVRHYDMAEVPWIKLLFDIRTLPDRFSKSAEDREIHLGVDDITEHETGFMILHESPGREVVVGAVGQFWHLKIPFVKVAPEMFSLFYQPGYGKIAWAIEVEPYGAGSTIAVELRTTATDEESWRKFSHYYGFIGLGSRLIRGSVMRHLETALGKMKFADEDTMALPGDELIPGTQYSLTLSAVVEAPKELVWRYLMQMGCDRAGWYSIDALDNGGRKSTDHLVEGWEERKAGDRISATPKGDDFFEVYAVKPFEFFVIGGESEKLDSPFKMTWSFVLEPVGESAVRLLTRARMHSAPAWKEWLMGRVGYPPVHLLMERVQLETIKKLAERDALQGLFAPMEDSGVFSS